jgi:hypothetical protein
LSRTEAKRSSKANRIHSRSVAVCTGSTEASPHLPVICAGLNAPESISFFTASNATEKILIEVAKKHAGEVEHEEYPVERLSDLHRGDRTPGVGTQEIVFRPFFCPFA